MFKFNPITEKLDMVNKSSSGTVVIGEVPTGDINDSNKIFTLAHTPTSGVSVYVGGARMKLTDDYTIITNTITFVSAPQTTTNILVDYTY